MRPSDFKTTFLSPLSPLLSQRGGVMKPKTKIKASSAGATSVEIGGSQTKQCFDYILTK